MIHNFSCLSYHPPQTFPIPILLQFLWNTPIPFLSYRNRIPLITRDSNYPLTRISLLYHIHFNGRPFPELIPFPPFLCSFLSSLSVVANFSKFSTWYRFIGYKTYDIFISFNSYISYFFFSSIFDQWIHFLFLTIFVYLSLHLKCLYPCISHPDVGIGPGMVWEMQLLYPMTSFPFLTPPTWTSVLRRGEGCKAVNPSHIFAIYSCHFRQKGSHFLFGLEAIHSCTGLASFPSLYSKCIWLSYTVHCDMWLIANFNDFIANNTISKIHDMQNRSSMIISYNMS